MGRETRLFSAVFNGLRGRPASSIALLFCVGIFLHPHLPRSTPFWILFLVGLTLAAWTYSHRANLASLCLAAAIVCAGVVAGQLADFQFRSADIALYATQTPQLAHVEVELKETPRLIADDGPRHLPPKQVGTATVVAIKTWSGWRPSSGEVLFSLSQAEPRLSAGQRMRLVGMLQRPSPAMNPGQFDWESYYRRQRVLTSIRVNHACDVQIMSAGPAPALTVARTGVREWLGAGFSLEHQVDRALLQALMLGDRGPEMRATERDFQKTGTSHLLSSSGVRMAVLAAMIFFMCRLLRVRPRATVATISLSVIAWGCLTLSSPQALRPVIVAATLGVGLIGKRSVDSIQLLAASALMILIVRPLDLYSAGFQFSFVIVLGMLLLTRPAMEFAGQLYDRDRRALERYGRVTLRRRAWQWLLHKLSQGFAASAVAWIVSLPLVAFHFEQFTPWAVPISIVLSPLVLTALGAGFVKLFLTMLIPSMAHTWAMIATAPLWLLRSAMGLCAKLPGADISVSPPSVWLMVLFYVLIFLPLIPWTGRRLRVGFRCGPLGACAILFLMPWLLGASGPRFSSGVLKITLLSVGAGQCAVVETPGREVIMLDAGSSTVADPLHLCIDPLLHHEGYSSVSTIFLSHGDYDHISAAGGAWEELGGKQVITTPYFRRHAKESVPCRNLLEKLDQSGHPPREVVAGQTFDWGGGAIAEVLWPPKSCNMNSNNAGMVLRLTFQGKSVLFPADIQSPAMHELLKNASKLKSDVLVAAHHGSSEPLTAEFVRAVDPEVIVSSDSSRLTKKQRDFEHLIEHRPLFRTGQCGAIEIDLDREDRVRVKPFIDTKQPAVVVEKDGRVHAAR